MEATCQCGQLKVRVRRAARAVVACHCKACQRRTGSPFGVAAYFPDDQVLADGVSKRFVRKTALGGDFESFFCPQCGSTVFFRGSKNVGVTGVAIGAFCGLQSMAPTRSVWEQSMHPWVIIPTALEHFSQGRL